VNVWPINIQISTYSTIAISKKIVFLKLLNVASGYKSKVMLPNEISIKWHWQLLYDVHTEEVVLLYYSMVQDRNNSS